MNNTNRLSWKYIDSPWDLLKDCEEFALDPNSSIKQTLCFTSSTLGVISAYILPFICFFGVVNNLMVAVVFLGFYKRPSRQITYISCLAISDALTQLFFGWLWLFPAKGLPFATRGRVYFFTFNQSRALCRLHRFAYSLTCTLSGNLLVIMAIDRCLCLYAPIRYSKLPRKISFYAIGVTFLITFCMMLPTAIFFDHNKENNLTTCSLKSHLMYLYIYQIFLSNSCLIQVIIVVILNIVFLIKIRHLLINRNKFSKKSFQGRELSASIILLLLVGAVLLASLPQSTAYIIALLLPTMISNSKNFMSYLRLAYNIADISWFFIFIQNSLNFVIYFVRIQRFRSIILSFIGIKNNKNELSVFQLSPTTCQTY